MPEFELPKALTDFLPEDLRKYAIYVAGAVVCVGSVVVLMMLAAVFRFLFGRRPKKAEKKNLVENLEEYPDLKSSGGDRQLRVEGVPARLRFIAVAPAGTTSEIELDQLGKILDELLPGLGDIYKHDKPRVKVWPPQVSYQGFAHFFHNNMNTGGADGEQTRWATLAGRVKVGKKQIMVGMALQSIKPNTVGQRTLDSHEWASVLRVRVKD